MTLSNAAMLEISELSTKAETLARGNPSDKAVASVYLGRIANIRTTGLSSDETRARYSNALNESLGRETTTTTASDSYKRAFHRYLLCGEKPLNDSERRDLLAGTETITYTEGAQGGFLIPLDYEKTLFTALAQTDEILSDEVCSFNIAPTTTLQPQIVSGYDLSTITATSILETAQQTASSFPSVAGKVLRANITYRVSLAGSIEAEQDVPGAMAKMARAMGVGFARKLGADAINGGGGTGIPNGITNGLSSVYSTGSGKITYNDLSSIYFSVNRVYRSSPKCGWLMSDSVYERVRNAVDNQGRPILDFLEDREVILGKPVYISPTLGQVGGSLALNSTIVFGDLSHFIVRCSKPTIARELNSATKGIEFGEALYVGRMRMDSVLFDPSSGSAPPVVISTVTS